MDNEIVKIIFHLFVIILGGILTIRINCRRGVQNRREIPKGLIKGPPPPRPPFIPRIKWTGGGHACREHPCNRDNKQ